MTHAILVSGEMGSYKTSSAVAMTIFEVEHASYVMGRKIPLITNMELKTTKDGPNIIHLKDANDWQYISQNKEFGSFLYLDELQGQIDSRRSNSRENIRLTQMMYYLRKMKCCFIGTTPDWMAVDVRLRNILTCHMHLRKVGKKVFVDYMNPSSDQVLRTRVLKLSTIRQYQNRFDTNAYCFPIDVPDTLEKMMGEC